MASKLVVSAADVSLFHVANRVWGDASAWLALADANGIADPFALGAPRTITVPDYDASFQDGVPQQ